MGKILFRMPRLWLWLLLPSPSQSDYDIVISLSCCFVTDSLLPERGLYVPGGGASFFLVLCVFYLTHGCLKMFGLTDIIRNENDFTPCCFCCALFCRCVVRQSFGKYNTCNGHEASRKTFLGEREGFTQIQIIKGAHQGAERPPTHTQSVAWYLLLQKIYPIRVLPSNVKIFIPLYIIRPCSDKENLKK